MAFKSRLTSLFEEYFVDGTLSEEFCREDPETNARFELLTETSVPVASFMLPKPDRVNKFLSQLKILHMFNYYGILVFKKCPDLCPLIADEYSPHPVVTRNQVTGTSYVLSNSSETADIPLDIATWAPNSKAFDCLTTWVFENCFEITSLKFLPIVCIIFRIFKRRNRDFFGESEKFISCDFCPRRVVQKGLDYPGPFYYNKNTGLMLCFSLVNLDFDKCHLYGVAFVNIGDRSQ